MLTTIRIASMGRSARMRALFLRFGWPALVVVAWPSMGNWRLRGVGNVQRMLAHGQLREYGDLDQRWSGRLVARASFGGEGGA